MSKKQKSPAFKTSVDRVRDRVSKVLDLVKFPRLTIEQWDLLQKWLDHRASRDAGDPTADPTYRIIHDARAQLHRDIMAQKPQATEELASSPIVITAI